MDENGVASSQAVVEVPQVLAEQLFVSQIPKSFDEASEADEVESFRPEALRERMSTAGLLTNERFRRVADHQVLVSSVFLADRDRHDRVSTVSVFAQRRSELETQHLIFFSEKKTEAFFASLLPSFINSV